MKKLILLTAVMVISGCGAIDRLGANITGSASETCYKGVLYLQFTSGASVAYNKDGTVMLCN